MDWSKVRHFKPEEFDSPDVPGSGQTGMDDDFVLKLDTLRHMWGRPLAVNSGFRSTRHNAMVGGKPNSAHLRGKAADLKMPNLGEAIHFAVFAAMSGFRRVGIDMHGGYVHLDSDATLPQPAIWFYNV